ncbi:MAG: NIPSNAP family protein [Eikenella sp.]|nr:NIPSNAP family protein [Eikenella sp.]
MQKLVEIRSYRLKPGSGAAFERVVREESAPLHAAFGIDVIAFGLSEHDADAFYLIRAFDDLAHLHSAQQAFYASPRMARRAARSHCVTHCVRRRCGDVAGQNGGRGLAPQILRLPENKRHTQDTR